ncbi:MAG: discoidin domain-containing protein, partial [Planctomycetota bacterium]
MKKTISLVLVLALCMVAKGDFTFGEPTNLGSTVNSSYYDWSPSITADGLEMYFESDRPGGLGTYDIWVSTRANKEDDWGAPTNLGAPINTPDWQNGPCISADGLELYFNDWGLWVVRRATVSDPWGEKENGSLININAIGGSAPSLSSDGLSLFLHSRNDWNLYVSTRPTRDDLWSEPVNLGPTVNGVDSAWENRDPTISADGLVLLFSSIRPGVSGGTDLWMTRRSTIDSPWSEPVNLGPTINSGWWEYQPEISADGRSLLFCSNRDDGHGDHDIWQASIIPPIAPPAWMRAPASNPSPANRATDVPRDVVLSWKPGIFVPATNGHKIYFSESFTDVKDGIDGVVQSAARFDPGRLAFSTTYYWRVDEVNAPPDSTVYPGAVWSFTTEPAGYRIDGANITATASSTGQAGLGPEKTIDGSGLDKNDLHSTEPTDMWLSANELAGAWIQYEFDKVYKLHEMWVWNSNQTSEALIGLGLRDVTVEYSTDEAKWTVLASVPDFAQSPGTAGYAHNTTVDFGGAVAKYVKLTATSNWGGLLPQYGLSEVRFFHIPMRAREPSPESGAAGIPPDVILSWRAGREAGTHDVSVSAAEQTVIDNTVTVATTTEASHDPSSLDLDTTYYWRIDEVNEAEIPSTWQGSLWSFATDDNIVVEDFESYNDLNPDDPDSKRIFNSWTDGYEQPANGAVVGYPDPPFCERTVVHSGRQSMPFSYSNTEGAAYSEAELTLSPAQDWTASGILTLAVHFHGTEGNTGQLYIKIDDTKVLYDGQASNLAQAGWQAWNIDLASSGASLQNVTRLAIGIDGTGASGTLYFDDIKVYAHARELITPFEPDATRLIGHWMFDGNTQDSSGRGNHGISGVSRPSFVAGKVGSKAMDFRGADYVAIDGVVDDITST